MSCRQKITYEPKWTISLTDLSLEDKIAVEGRKFVSVIIVISVFYVAVVILIMVE